MNDEVRQAGDDPAADEESAKASEQAAEAREDAAAAAAEGEAADRGPADEDVDALRAEADRMRDAALRAQAEMENVRRRAARDVESAHKFALEKFAAGLLPVVDSLEKSVEAVSAHEGGDEAMVAIKEGIRLSERMLLDTLEKFGIERIDPLGESFDPDRHEAMAMIPAPDAEPNSVVDVLQKGYALNGRLVRAAMVVVAKGAGG